jgi:hypothetical protein
VAFEYGQTWWAMPMTFSACSRSVPGIETLSDTPSLKPRPSRSRWTSESTLASSAGISRFWATSFTDERKQAA